MQLSSVYRNVVFTRNPTTLALQDVDSGVPTVVIYKNGVVDTGIAITATKITTGKYKLISDASFADGGFANGDTVSIEISSTVDSETDSEMIGNFELEDTSSTLEDLDMTLSDSDPQNWTLADWLRWLVCRFGGAATKSTAAALLTVKHPITGEAITKQTIVEGTEESQTVVVEP
jgi:hypothetical protein